jgi:starch phosphorylase
LTDLEGLQAAIEALSDQELWRFRHESRAALVTYARQRLSHQYRLLGMDPASERAILEALDPHALTLGFARRFTAYKRPTLLLHDRGRLAALLKNTDRPVQLIVAGKAHPQDEDGKRLVQAFVQFARSDDVRQRVVFLQDYDIDLAQQLVQGVDVWINTPKRPWEACGTSGMKVLVNGGLNLSEVDGWWAEAYNPGLGWAMMSPQNDPDVSTDAAEAEQLYDVLERDVIPMFYRRNEAGIPVEWVARMRNSMAQLTPRFSSNRMLREYVERLYLAAATRVRERAAQPPSVKDLLLWEERLARHWDSVAFGEVLVERHGGQWTFIASLHLGELPPDDVTVELYADAVGNRPMMREPMHRLPGRECAGAHRYEVRIMTDRPANHFTIRAMAYHPNAVIPQEASYIRWQR